MMRRLFFGLFLFSSSLFAHPHIFVDVLLDIHVDSKEQMHTEITWRFDPMVTQQFLMDFDMDSDGTFNADEMAELRAATFDTLAGHAYFTRLTLDKHKIALGDIAQFEAYIKEERLHYHYNFKEKHAIGNLKKIFLSCYDPDFYISMVMKKPWITLHNEGKKSIQPIIKIAKSPNGFVYALELKVK